MGFKFKVFWTVFLFHFLNAAPLKWVGQIPSVAEKSENWRELVAEMMKLEMYFGAMSASYTMIHYFQDLTTKETSYSTIISLIDKGFPFSAKNIFVPGDIDPSPKTDFGKSYLLYKAIVNAEKKMDKWAEHYFNKFDKENFSKFLFYKAMESYRSGKLEEAATTYKRVLSLTTTIETEVLSKKAARNLARIYYETQKFDKSYEIYSSFLLKTNPINPLDWLEASWSLYQLKRYPEALGFLYNLEASDPKGSSLTLEKYVLRALVYHEYCDVQSTANLIKKFNQEYGKIIDGIKQGEALAKYPVLEKIIDAETAPLRAINETMSNLENESLKIKKMPGPLQELANFLYQSEKKMLKRNRQLILEDSLKKMAQRLVILGESLKFLQFDVTRFKFDPDRVFAEKIETSDLTETLIEDIDEKQFRQHWIQYGDYWRDERLKYQGVLKSKCEQ